MKNWYLLLFNFLLKFDEFGGDSLRQGTVLTLTFVLIFWGCYKKCLANQIFLKQHNLPSPVPEVEYLDPSRWRRG